MEAGLHISLAPTLRKGHVARVMSRHGDEPGPGSRAVAVVEGDPDDVGGDASGAGFEDGAAEHVDPKVAEFEHGEGGEAGAVTEVVHQAKTLHAGHCRLAHGVEDADRPRVDMRADMDVAVHCVLYELHSGYG